MSSYDYVIVGAGSSGSALAGMLAENNKIKILLLETEHRDNKFSIKILIGYGKLFSNRSVNWKFNTEPEKILMGKKCIGLKVGYQEAELQ